MIKEDTLLKKMIAPLLQNAHGLGGTDDCGYFENNKYSITSDVIVENVHFLPKTSPESLAHKLVVVNVSDIISSGARAKYALLNYSFRPEQDSFSQRFLKKLNDYSTNIRSLS